MRSSPTDVNPATWFYDEEHGINVVHEARTKAGEYIQTDQFTIPWRLLREALARKDRRKAPRKIGVGGR